MMADKSLDVICMGRILVDLYGEQVGGRLEDMKSFAKYVGGSSGNMCIGMSRQGLRAAMLSRVGDEHMGRFVYEQLQKEGVNVSHLSTDPERLTALVILGIRDEDTFPLIFYRENCADMAIDEDDIDEAFIASAKALVITGTHLSTDRVNTACLTAIKYARRNDTRVVLDIDYRPVLWGLTGHGFGESRFVSSKAVSAQIRAVIPSLDLIVGTEEEFLIAGGQEDISGALKSIRQLTAATLVVKRGALGATVIPAAVPENLNDGLVVSGARVDVFNVLGAGDGFMAGFMRGWVNGEALDKCARYANACGALVVSRHGCSTAIPSKDEVDYYLTHSERIDRPDLDPVIQRMHRVTSRTRGWPQICVLAFDHRRQLEEMANEFGADISAISKLKRLIYDGAKLTAQHFPMDGLGLIIDSTYGDSILDAATGSGWWIGRPMELPGSRPLEFQCGDDVSREIRQWPGEHVVKCLVFYGVDDEISLRQKQEQKVLSLYEACVADGREILLEVIPPMSSLKTKTATVAMLERFYEIGVYPDWWKLPQQDSETWRAVGEVISRCDPDCRGVVILGLDAPISMLAESFCAAAGHSLVKGFAVGRSIFSEPARAWFSGSIDDATVVQGVSHNFTRVIELWQNRNKSSVTKRTAV